MFTRRFPQVLVSAGLFCLAVVLLAPRAVADAVVDWNQTAADIIAGGKIPPGVQIRAMAVVQVAVYEAASAISGRYPAYRFKITAPPGASLDAAVAGANHRTLLALVPTQHQAIDAAYQASLAKLPDGPARTNGIEVGEKAAAALLSFSAEDGAVAPDTYRPQATPGLYVPTALPATPQWGHRRTWLLQRPDQFRPEAPPRLTSDIYARDYNEIKALGARAGATRTAEQTEIAGFWEPAGSSMFWPVVRSVASGFAGRDASDNALLFAAYGMAEDDAIIATWDAKYTYNFWRPLTAIRNGDLDGNASTERDAAWMPFIDTPPHPEYPCAHCVAAGATAAVLEAVVGSGPVPWLLSPSTAAPNAVHHWSQLSDLVTEVRMARVYDGVHFRNSTEVGAALGKKVGEWVVKTFLKPALLSARAP